MATPSRCLHAPLSSSTIKPTVSPSRSLIHTALPSSCRLQQSPAAPSPIDVRFVLVTGGPVSGAATGYGELRSSSASESSATSIALASLAAENENYGATPATMRAMTIGFIIMLLSVSAGMHFGTGGFGLLLCFLGVLVGASLVAAGVSMADGSTPIVLVVFASARAIAAFVHRNTAVVGLVMASCAVTTVSIEADPMLCFGMYALLLLGLTLINIGARRE